MVDMMAVGLVPGGSVVAFQYHCLYGAGLSSSCNCVLHPNHLRAVSDHVMPIAAADRHMMFRTGMKVYEMRLGTVIKLCVRVLISKAQARS